MLSFLSVLGLGIAGMSSLTGCDKRVDVDSPAHDTILPKNDEDGDGVPDGDVKIKAPGVDIEVDRPRSDKDIEVDVDPN